MSLAVKRAKYGAGDPGLFGFLGGVAKKITGITKHIPGPIGSVTGLVNRALPGGARTPARPAIQPVAPRNRPAWQPPQQPVPGLRGIAQRIIPGGQSGYMPDPAVAGSIGVPPKGYKLNKTGYYLKDGTYVPPESKWVKIRKTNPLNPRAASKSIRRIEGLKRATKRFSNITIRKKCCT